ncbi:NAD(P)-dependent oxidoreductase [bacterium]|nr:NAD(P)-dependent oxidoreductase [bacterium]
MTRVLVTGATGYVGSRLVQRLVASEAYQVSVLVRPTSDLTRLGKAREAVQILPTEGDVSSLTQAMKEARPEAVVHLASLYLSQHTPADVGPLVDSNVRFGACLLEAMVQAGVTRLLNTGTAWETMDGPPDYRPACLYAATKRAFDALLCFYEDAYDLRSLTLKLYDTYGPDDWRPKLFSLLKRSVASGESIPFSPGEQLLDLTHVDDLTDAFERGIRSLCSADAPRHRELHVGSGKGRSLKEIVSLFESVGGVKANLQWGARPYRDREVMRAVADPSEARTVLGWEARIDLREGIRAAFFQETDR